MAHVPLDAFGDSTDWVVSGGIAAAAGGAPDHLAGGSGVRFRVEAGAEGDHAERVLGAPAGLETVTGFSPGHQVVLVQGNDRLAVRVQAVGPVAKKLTWETALTAEQLATFKKPDTVLAVPTVDLTVRTPDGEVVEQRTGLSLERTAAKYAVSVVNDPRKGLGCSAQDGVFQDWRSWWASKPARAVARREGPGVTPTTRRVTSSETSPPPGSAADYLGKDR